MSEDAKERVVLVVPTAYSVHIEVEFAIKNFILPDPRFHVGLVYPRDSFAKGAAQMRNFGIRQVMEIEPLPEWTVFLDSDTVPDGNPLDAIADNVDADVIALLTPIWAPTHNPVDPVISNIWLEGAKEARWIDLDGGGPFVPILKAGAGCLIVRTSILLDKEIRFIPSLDDEMLWERSEDLSFCDRAREKGHKIALYTPVMCGHCQYVDISKVHDAIQYWKQQAIAALRRVRVLEEEQYAMVSR